MNGTLKIKKTTFCGPLHEVDLLNSVNSRITKVKCSWQAITRNILICALSPKDKAENTCKKKNIAFDS